MNWSNLDSRKTKHKKLMEVRKKVVLNKLGYLEIEETKQLQILLHDVTDTGISIHIISLISSRYRVIILKWQKKLSPWIITKIILSAKNNYHTTFSVYY